MPERHSTPKMPSLKDTLHERPLPERSYPYVEEPFINILTRLTGEFRTAEKYFDCNNEKNKDYRQTPHNN